MKKTWGIGLVLFICFLTAAYGETPSKKADSPKAKVPGVSAARLIRPGDTLKISVWKYSDLDATVSVNTEGEINYSFIGDVVVAGKTAEEVRKVITEGLDKNYIANPRVDVKIETKLPTIFVVGEVQKPGGYPYEPGLDPLKAIAIAGGTTDFASNTALIVRKDAKGRETQMKVNTKKLMKANPNRSRYELEPGDIVVVKKGWF